MGQPQGRPVGAGSLVSAPFALTPRDPRFALVPTDRLIARYRESVRGQACRAFGHNSAREADAIADELHARGVTHFPAPAPGSFLEHLIGPDPTPITGGHLAHQHALRNARNT